MRNPIKIIGIGFAIFFVLLFSTWNNLTWDCTWHCMNWFDKILLVLFCGCVGWLFYVGLTRGKK